MLEILSAASLVLLGYLAGGRGRLTLRLGALRWRHFHDVLRVGAISPQIASPPSDIAKSNFLTRQVPRAGSTGASRWALEGARVNILKLKIHEHEGIMKAVNIVRLQLHSVSM